MARRKMNEDVAYARNTESGCNIQLAKFWALRFIRFDGPPLLTFKTDR